jgi:GT2 family glycosyltransferase
MRPLISIVIPTYNRNEVLVDTVRQLLNLRVAAAELILVDQTLEHSTDAKKVLQRWDNAGAIRWIRLACPSITAAMNCGLREARHSHVLFLDDDIEPTTELVAGHLEAHAHDPELWATVGQVVQPWQTSIPLRAPRKLKGLRAGFDFPFHSTLDSDVQNVMAGNLCVNREQALSIGGFDENFVGSAFRFETEFARRVGHAGGRIRFVGSAGIRHLRVVEGGTRSQGSHLTSADPKHGIGDYYYAYLHGNGFQRWSYVMYRMIREVSTKFHLTHPWWIPVKLTGELRAMWQGWKLAKAKKAETNDRD